MSIFTLLAFVNILLSVCLIYSCAKKMSMDEVRENKSLEQILVTPLFLGMVSLVLHLSYISGGEIHDIYDARRMAWSLFDMLMLISMIRLIRVAK